MPVQLQSYTTSSIDPYKLLTDLRAIVDLANKLEVQQRSSGERLTVVQRAIEAAAAGQGGSVTPGPPGPIGPFPSVYVDPAGAILGDGTAVSPLRASVDGVTVVIVGNQLTAVVPPDVITGTLTTPRIPYATAPHVLGDSAAMFWNATPETFSVVHGGGSLDAPETNAKPQIHVGGDFDGVAAGIGVIYIDGYGAQGNFTMRRANGTQAAKTALADTNIIFNFRAYGWDGSDWGLGGLLRMTANGTWTTANHAQDFLVLLTAPDSVANPTERFRIKGDGRTGLGTSTPLATLQVNGNGRFGFGLPVSYQTTINIVGGISAADTTITVVSTTNFPVSGIVLCQGELISYASKTATTLDGCVRGRFLTTAATHANGQIVAVMPLVVAESDTSGSALITGPAKFFLGTQGDLFDIGSGSAVAVVKIGNQFSVSGTAGVAWQDAAVTGMCFMLWDGTNAVFGTRTNAPIAFRTNNTARAYITSNQNLILDAATNSDPATGTKCLILGDGTAPATLDANTCGLFGEDVGGTVNVFGVNELGEYTQITGGLGYPTGQGGAVTQATNKATGVTLSKYTGAITMNNAALAANTIVSFTLTNTKIAANDLLVLNHDSGGTLGAYLLNAACAAGSAVIYVHNVTAGSLSEAIVIQFAVIRGAIA